MTNEGYAITYILIGMSVALGAEFKKKGSLSGFDFTLLASLWPLVIVSGIGIFLLNTWKKCRA